MSEQGALPGSPLPSLPLEAATAVTVCPLRALGAVPAASQGAHSASISYSKLSSQKVLRILATTPTASAPPAAPPGAPRHGDLPPRRVTRRTLCRYAACACARGEGRTACERAGGTRGARTLASSACARKRLAPPPRAPRAGCALQDGLLRVAQLRCGGARVKAHAQHTRTAEQTREEGAGAWASRGDGASGRHDLLLVR